ncbi:MAG: DegV family protein [Acholeplasmatales bacterium]|nr:DegV family protein [Acholeplasmatales bacterium]
MNKVKIITDSTCDLGKDLAKEFDVEIVPLYVIFGDHSYEDGVEITTAEIYKKVEELGELPKTSAITTPILVDIFSKWYNEGYDIVFTGISSKMSRTYQSAVLAAEEVNPEKDRIYIVDSKNLSTGIGLLVVHACMDRDKGLSAKEIAENMAYNADRAKVQFAIERMDYLHKGGRCSGVARFVGTILSMKPIIFVRDGAMSVGRKPIGKMKVALNSMLKLLIEDKEKDNVREDVIFVTHSIAVESCAYLLPEVKKLYPNARVIETVAGGVIASHCGPGTIGILYICKEPVK